MALRASAGKTIILTPESLVLKSCLEWLYIHKIPAWRMNTGSFKTETGNYVRFGAPGMSDILAVVNGKFTAIECKAGNNKLSNKQIEFKEKVVGAAGIYITAYSIDDLEQSLKPII